MITRPWRKRRARATPTSRLQLPPATSHQRPAATYRTPAIGHQPPAVSHQSPLTTHQSPVTSHLLSRSSRRLEGWNGGYRTPALALRQADSVNRMAHGACRPSPADSSMAQVFRQMVRKVWRVAGTGEPTGHDESSAHRKQTVELWPYLLRHGFSLHLACLPKPDGTQQRIRHVLSLGRR